MSGLWCKCAECGEDGACFFLVEERRICSGCIARKIEEADEARIAREYGDLPRRFHDQIQHPWPILGCEQCGARELRR